MWLLLAFSSAFLLGFYDVTKKKSLGNNAVIPVLFLNTLFSSLIFLPFIISSANGWIDDTSLFYTHSYGWTAHKYIVLKSLIVLSSWILGYFGIKHLPITIVGPINATRPMMVLIGALLIFNEHLTLFQWLGVLTAIFSFFYLSHSGKKEGIDFKHDKWIVFVVLSNVLGALSGLYDKYLMASPAAGGVGLDKMAVQSWYNIYQFFMMLVILLFLSGLETDLKMFLKYSFVGSMVGLGGVVVSFLVGAMVFKEKNLKSKAIDLSLVVLSMILLYIGSKYGI